MMTPSLAGLLEIPPFIAAYKKLLVLPLPPKTHFITLALSICAENMSPCLSCSQQPWSFKRLNRERKAAPGKGRVPDKLSLRLSWKLLMNKI